MAAQSAGKASLSRRFIFASMLPLLDRDPAIALMLRLDPDIGALKPLQKQLLTEFLEVARNFERLRRLRAFLDIAQCQHGPVIELEFDGKIELAVDPRGGVVAGGRYAKFPAGAAIEAFGLRRLAAPLAAVADDDAGDFRHRPPLRARVEAARRNEQPGQPARLLGIHEDAQPLAHQISSRNIAVDDQEAVGKVRRLDAHLAIRHEYLSRTANGSAGRITSDQLRRELLRLYRQAAEEDSGGKCESEHHAGRQLSGTCKRCASRDDRRAGKMPVPPCPSGGGTGTRPVEARQRLHATHALHLTRCTAD